MSEGTRSIKISQSDYDHMGRMIESLQQRYGRQFDRSTFISMMFDFIWSYPNDIKLPLEPEALKSYNEEQIMRTRWYYYTEWAWGRGIQK